MVNFQLTASEHDHVSWEQSFDNSIYPLPSYTPCMICFKTTCHEQWFHYKHFVHLLWSLTLQLFSICHHSFHKWWISSRLENLQFTGGVHLLRSQLNSNSLVVKWETSYSPVHMNAALDMCYIIHILVRVVRTILMYSFNKPFNQGSRWSQRGGWIEGFWLDTWYILFISFPLLKFVRHSRE